MPYGNRIEFDVATQQEQSIAVDDAWILANKEEYLAISGPGSATVEVAFNITLQLKTPILTNDTRNNVSQPRVVTIIVTLNGDIVEATYTLNGSGTITDSITPQYAGTVVVKPKSMDGDVFSVEAV